MVGGVEGRKGKNQGYVEVLNQVTERIESPSTEIGKATVGRVLGKNLVRSSVLEVKFEVSRPPSGDSSE